MNLNVCHDRKAWDAAVVKLPRSPFLQSWGWGIFQQSLGRSVFRIGGFENDALHYGVQAIIMPLPLGHRYVYIPRGPFSLSEAAPFSECMAQLKKSAPAALFARCDFGEHFSTTTIPGSVPRPSLQPQQTLVLDLTPSEDELLGSFHEKTRYNIRLAERKGVQVSVHDALEAVESFFPLLTETNRRDRISSHAPAYYHAMMKTLAQSGMLHLWTASLGQTLLAANIAISFGDTVTYLHGASGSESRNVMAPHLLQWAQIRDAKARGFHWYDFFGVAPKGADASHRWSGITRFKSGFGGQMVRYPAAADIPFRPSLYRLYRAARSLRRLHTG